ncbi:MAG TPA: hypothetical protein VJN18_19045 [Polyangiaceae bacterium]|nr:hypothetical protein [Polyangiaceae bacterium]
MKLGRLGVVLALVWLSPALASAGEAATAPVSDSSVARVVEIRVSGDAAALGRVRITAHELLRRLDVQPLVRAVDEPAPADEPTPLVVAHLDLRSVSSPRIDIEDGRTRQELTRRALSDVSSLETGVEALLHVLYLSVESSLQVGVPKTAPAPPDKPEPPAPKRQPEPKPTRAALDLGPFMRMSSLGGDRIVPGGGLTLEPRLSLGRVQAGVAISGAVHGTSDLAFASGIAQVRPVQLRAIPTFDWQFSPGVSGCFGVGGGVDSLLVDPVQTPEVGSVVRHESALDPVVTGLLGARVPVSNRIFLSALASLDLDLAPTSFVARRGSVNEPLLQLPRLRGGFTLALSFTAAGAHRFSRLELER